MTHGRRHGLVASVHKTAYPAAKPGLVGLPKGVRAHRRRRRVPVQRSRGGHPGVALPVDGGWTGQ